MMKQVELAEELLKRRKARKSLSEFSKYINPDEPPAKHHRLLCDALDDVIEGRLRRLMVFWPPGMAKSTYSSVRFPGYFLGKYPEKSIICGSYGEGLATSFGRKVRNMLLSREYGVLFETRLSEDSRAKGEWETQKGGSYFACGVGSGVTGRRADLAVIDDPMKGRKESDSELIRNDTWDWYIADFLTRLKPGSAQVIIQCMTGDTPVTMADGSTKHLRYIKTGDSVATYKNGEITSSKVLNWKNQGLDNVYKLKTSSGIIVRANERHPFLMKRKGKLEWVRLKNLNVGENVLRVIGVNGKELNAQKRGVKKRYPAKGYVRPIIIKNDGQTGFVRLLLAKIRHLVLAQNSNIVMALRSMTTRPCYENKTGVVLYVDASPKTPEIQNTGTTFSALTIAMKRLKSEVFSVMTAIWRLDAGKLQKFWKPQQLTSDFSLDQIMSIEHVGIEEVFDIQVDRTENFIANGLISHNTRWHEDDLSGRILPSDWNGESGDFEGFDGQIWKVICLPAEARENDILGRKKGEWLWTEWCPEEEWIAIKRAQTAKDVRNWGALFQQMPQPESGVFFKREWFQRFNIGEQPQLSLYGASDYAVSDGEGDFTEHGVGGFDASENLYFVDWWSGQTTADKWIETQLRMVSVHPVLLWAAEGGVIRRAVEPFLIKAKRDMLIDGKHVYFNSEWITSGADKAANSRSFQALASMGKVYIPNTEWGNELIDQLVKFIPNTNFRDDKVDVCGLFGRILGRTFGARLTVVPKVVKPDSYGFNEEPENNWKTV